MPSTSRRAFRRRFRRLAPAERERVVAAVYAAAGWTVSRETGRVVVEREEPVPERRELVVAADSADPTMAGASAGRLPTQGTGTGSGDRRIVDADDLYDRLRYGLDRDTAEDILATHAPADGPDRDARDPDPSPHRSGGAGPADPATERSTGRSERAARWGRLAAVVLVIAAALAGGLADPDGPGPPPLSVDDRTETFRRVVTCPAPPRAVAPAVLRPRIGPPPLTSEAWRRTGATRLGAFDLLDRSSIATPDRLALATYVGPGGRRYRVSVGRWANRSLAAGAGTGMGVPHVVYAWGPYTLAVQSETADGRHRRGPAAIAASRRVIEGVPAASVSTMGVCGVGQL